MLKLDHALIDKMLDFNKLVLTLSSAFVGFLLITYTNNSNQIYKMLLMLYIGSVFFILSSNLGIINHIKVKHTESLSWLTSIFWSLGWALFLAPLLILFYHLSVGNL